MLKRSHALLLFFALIIFWEKEAYSGFMPTENSMPEKLIVPAELLNVKIPDKFPSVNFDVDMPKLSDFEGKMNFQATENVNIPSIGNLQEPYITLKDQLFVWPVMGSKISSGYGFRLGGAQGGIHHGIDIPMPHGTPIFAARDGVVKRADSVLRGYGKLVIIDHGGGVETRYAHCSAFATQSGDAVKAGQIIAYVGNSGNSTADHLHFEVVINGLAYNPMRFFGEYQPAFESPFTKKF